MYADDAASLSTFGSIINEGKAFALAKKILQNDPSDIDFNSEGNNFIVCEGHILML